MQIFVVYKEGFVQMHMQRLKHPCAPLHVLGLEIIWYRFKTSRHGLQRSPIHLSPLPSLPLGALRQRAEWSRAVCGDSDIHHMQWIINEHHLAHTTGARSSNRLLHDDSLSLSPSLHPTPCLSLFHCLSHPSSPTFPTHITPTQLLSHVL